MIDSQSKPQDHGSELYGVLCLLGAAFFFSIMSLLVKTAGQRLPPAQLILARGVVTLILSYGWLRATKISPWGVNKRLLFWRGFWGFGGLSCFFTALTILPLAEATVLHYINPLITAALAAVLLGERIGASFVVGVGLCLVGVVLVVQPELLFASPSRLPWSGILFALGGAAFSAAAYVTVRKLRATDQPLVIVFYFPLVAVPLTIPFVVPVWMWPTPREWALLVGIGAVTQIAQILLTRGLLAVPAGPATAIGYVQIIFATIWGIFLFGEYPGWLSGVGALLVVAGTLAVAVTRALRRPA